MKVERILPETATFDSIGRRRLGMLRRRPATEGEEHV
jgi:hypothetical protein